MRIGLGFRMKILMWGWSLGPPGLGCRREASGVQLVQGGRGGGGGAVPFSVSRGYDYHLDFRATVEVKIMEVTRHSNF